jgi:hypothetical protein
MRALKQYQPRLNAPSTTTKKRDDRPENRARKLFTHRLLWGNDSDYNRDRLALSGTPTAMHARERGQQLKRADGVV